MMRTAARAGALAAFAVMASVGSAPVAGVAGAAGTKRCGTVCVFAKPDFKGKRICYLRPARAANIEKAWGQGFVPGSVKVSRRGRCSPIAYFFTERGYRGVVAAYFGSAADITARKFRSFRLKHSQLED
jgi:hypothetical protein